MKESVNHALPCTLFRLFWRGRCKTDARERNQVQFYIGTCLRFDQLPRDVWERVQAA